MWSVYERGRIRKQGRNQRKISVIHMHSTNGADLFVMISLPTTN